MPAPKPKALITRHETEAEKSQRESREAALRPERSLPMGAPARLTGHLVAEATWRRLMRTYGEIDGEIVTRLDMDLLVDYCMLIEQITEIDKMRSVAYAVWMTLAKKHGEYAATDENEAAVAMALKVVNAFDAIVKLDGRADRKRSLLLQLRQSLYMTPRARAGVAPAKKEEPEPPDELEMLLNEANDAIGHGK